MENQLAKYMGKNYSKVIKEVIVVQGTAKDSGNIYYAVELKFINGYSKRLFLRNDEAFAWANAFELIETQNSVDML